MDKQKEKEKLVKDFYKQFVKAHNENMWNANDTFDVACWFMGGMIAAISNENIVTREELHTRIKNDVIEWIDDVFMQLKENEQANANKGTHAQDDE